MIDNLLNSAKEKSSALKKFPLVFSDRIKTMRSMWKSFYAQDWEDKWVPMVSLGLLLVCFLYGAVSIISRSDKGIPAEGGSIVEGIIGVPRTIHPLLASSDADRDLATLIYSGVLKREGNSVYTEDLADSVIQSQSGKVYTITLKEGVTFHDGTRLTAQDVGYTYNLIAKKVIDTPLSVAWKGVRVDITGKRTIVLTLPKPRPNFKEQLTVGILPYHIWKNISPENIKKARATLSPVGSGPFKVSGIEYSKEGNPETYTLARFEGYALKPALLDSIILKFYPSIDTIRDAYEDGVINAWARIPPEEVKQIIDDEQNIIQFPLARAFVVFINLAKPHQLADKELRNILSESIDRSALIGASTHGIGNPIKNLNDISWNTPWQSHLQRATIPSSESSRLSSLSFVLTTPDIPELTEVAKTLKEIWTQEGATVMINRVSQSTIAESIIVPRKFETLLYGITLSQYSDLVAYLHSSERTAQGLNISGYSRNDVDTLSYRISKISSTNTSSSSQKLPDELRELSERVEEDVPFILLYQPELVYLIPPHVKGIKRTLISSPRDRFIDVTSWYMRTSRN